MGIYSGMNGQSSRKRIVLADDHQMFRQGLRVLLDQAGYEVVGEAADGLELIRLVRELSPSLAILDIGMPQLNGIDAAREISKRFPETNVILLTMFEDEMYVLEALKVGVRGYVLKAQASSDLISAVQEVLNGSVYLSPGISETVVKASLTHRNTDELLTDRERQVLQLIAEGHTTKEIAGMLDVSVKTAESHRTRIMHKLDIHETATLVRYAIRRGLISA